MRVRGQDGHGGPLIVDAATSARLGRVRQRGTEAELRVGQLLRDLHIRAGRTTRRLPGSPDLVNLSSGWCIFVHGCFWHAHPGCGRATLPKRNRAFWKAKFDANRRRDERAVRASRKEGLRPVVVWECDVLNRPGSVRRKLERLLVPKKSTAKN